MSDPLHHKNRKASLDDISDLKFAKLHSPKMKSVYWRHFGFPTNESDRIITKQNVVCTICHKVLTNHGNTTNLRAHLQHRHKDIFMNICTENGIKVPPRKTPLKQNPTRSSAQRIATRSAMKREPLDRKIKLEFDGSEYSTLGAAGNEEDHAMLYETMMPLTYDDDDVIDADHFAKVEVVGSGVGVVVASELPEARSEVDDMTDEIASTTGAAKNDTHYRLDEIEEFDPYQMQEALMNIVVRDVRNVSSLFDAGMLQLMRTFGANVTIPTEKKIEEHIKELHSDKLTTLADQIKIHSQLKPYSLGFETWSNVEQKSFISVYFNYTTDAPDYNLYNVLYCTLEYNKYTVIDAIFEGFNLMNCTAALLSNEGESGILQEYLRNKNIPIIYAFDTTIDKCLRNVFSMPAIESIVEDIREVIMRFSTEIIAKDVEVPTVNTEFPWTYYELLKFFSEMVSWPEDVEMLVLSARTIVDTLSTLAVTLDTLKSEETPHSSMLSPITLKILHKKLALSESDDEFVIQIKTTVMTTLQELVLSDDNLMISALLDPRFHRLTSITGTQLNNCLVILTEKYKKICEFEIDAPSLNSNDEIGKLNGSKKSNLELFFDVQEQGITATPNERKNNVEGDMQRYRKEVYTGLDESPFLWWNKMGHLYGTLKQLAALYQCVPCVVNMNFKKPIHQQVYERQKRYMLHGNLIDAILFLHHNVKCS